MQKKTIYLLGICGTGVGSLAGLLKSLGHTVRGSDEHVYPPMSDKLREWGIEVLTGYDARHLDPPPDLAVVGNVIRRTNPEAVAVVEKGIPSMSMPQAVAEFGIGDRHSVVFAGTHGKTTTSALAAHILLEAGRDPGFLVGGALNGYPDSFRAGAGDVFVIEGDEYDTAYFDKGPKFWHYRPTTAVITSLEFDHADIYADIHAIERSFAGLIERTPPHGHLVLWQGATRALRLADEHARAHGQVARRTVYGHHRAPGVDLWLGSYASGPEGLRFEPVLKGESLGEMTLAQWGEFSANNALAVVAALIGVGLSPDAIREGMATFRGVKRRMEVRGEPGGITVVDDFAHHPTAVGETLRAARTRWPDRRIWAVFEPRSATNRRNVHQAEFVHAFSHADRVIIGSHERLQEVEESERFSPERLAADLAEVQVPCSTFAEPSAIADHLVDEAQPGDVIMVLSNGSFGGLHEQLLTRLA